MSLSPTSKEYARQLCVILDIDPDARWGDVNNALCDAYTEGSDDVFYRGYGSSICRSGIANVKLTYMEQYLGIFQQVQVAGLVAALRRHLLDEQRATAWALPESGLMLLYDPNYERWRLLRKDETVLLMDRKATSELFHFLQRAQAHMGWE